MIKESDLNDIFMVESISHMRVAEPIAEKQDIFPILDLLVDREVFDYRLILVEAMDDRLSYAYSFSVLVPDEGIGDDIDIVVQLVFVFETVIDAFVPESAPGKYD